MRESETEERDKEEEREKLMHTLYHIQNKGGNYHYGKLYSNNEELS